MKDLELSSASEADLEYIFDYSYERFDAGKAIEYVSAFDDVFEQILINPKIGKDRPEIRTGLSSFVKDAHVIFYRVRRDKIRIVRILHGARDLTAFIE